VLSHAPCTLKENWQPDVLVVRTTMACMPTRHWPPIPATQTPEMPAMPETHLQFCQWEQDPCLEGNRRSCSQQRPNRLQTPLLYLAALSPVQRQQHCNSKA